MRHKSPRAPIASAAASAIDPTVREWLYVLGARRINSCSSGWETSPSSKRLKSVNDAERPLHERQDSGHQEPRGDSP